MTTFLSVSIEGLDTSAYTVTCRGWHDFFYYIFVKPIGYAFLYNRTVTVTTKAQPAIIDTAANFIPFKPTVYSKSKTISWFVLRSPSMTEGEKMVINTLGKINHFLSVVTTAPVVA